MAFRIRWTSPIGLRGRCSNRSRTRTISSISFWRGEPSLGRTVLISPQRHCTHARRLVKPPDSAVVRYIGASTGNESMDHGIHTDEFVGNYQKALADSQLQRALKLATDKFTVHRSYSVADVGEEWADLRTRARDIKEHAVGNLDHYLDEFSTNVERLGGKVFWAHDAAEANQYITRLATERGVRLAVKSKSMMTEEVELNRAFEAAGVEAVETDLGEYIVQLAGERPSHILAPAIHKTRGQIADLFTDKLHVERTEEIEEMTAIARKVLRDRFASAGMGVTGANFGIAETGTIVLVENEGNIRLTTSLPKVHVALMGIEKVIPRLEDLTVLLRVLPRSASGQKMSSYVSFIS